MKIYVPCESKYFIHLDETIKRLLGYTTDNRQLDRIREGLVKNHDFQSGRKKLLKLKVKPLESQFNLMTNHRSTSQNMRMIKNTKRRAYQGLMEIY